ncbi:MAG: Beta-lactamase OXA-10 [bacterium]|nr:Beta-lactamase OXA-10 [bacterium]
MNLFATVVVLALISSNEQASPDFARHFAGIDGTFVLYDSKSDRYYRHNEKRCAERFSPCSTFKIPNALIALETGVVPDENFTIKWDSVKTPRQNFVSPMWARDHDLRSAMRYSVVWYFQEVARRVGASNYKKYLQQFEYGNRDIAGGSDRFWLSNSLQISANEQIKFIRKFYSGKLGLAKRTTDVVKSIIILEQTAQYKLCGKTGAGPQANGKMLGWLVGYVETPDNVYFYALNFDGENFQAVAAKRLNLAKALLKELKVLP